MKTILSCVAIFFIFNVHGQEIIHTVAGDGIHAYAGDGGPATAAELQYPIAVCRDTAGNIYILDLLSSSVREIYAATGIINIIAGSETDYGNTGDGGPAIDATLDFPLGICVSKSGFIYIADNLNNRIRMIDPSDNFIYTIAGHDTASYSGDGGPATNALINSPSSVAVDDSENVYIADSYNNRIRKISASTGIITTVAGNGMPGYSGDGTSAISAQIDSPTAIAVDGIGDIFIADPHNARVRKVSDVTGIISTIAGNGIIGYTGDGGPASNAQLYDPIGISTDDSNNIYIADQGVSVIRKISSATGIISTVAGNGTAGYSGDGGSPTLAQLNYPTGVCTNKLGTIIDIADKANGRIRQIDNGELSVVTKTLNSEFEIFPNPSNGIFSVTCDGILTHDIKVVNYVGECVYQKTFNTPHFEINLNGITSGIYLLYDNNALNHKVYKLTVIN